MSLVPAERFFAAEDGRRVSDLHPPRLLGQVPCEKPSAVEPALFVQCLQAEVENVGQLSHRRIDRNLAGLFPGTLSDDAPIQDGVGARERSARQQSEAEPAVQFQGEVDSLHEGVRS